MLTFGLFSCILHYTKYTEERIFFDSRLYEKKDKKTLGKIEARRKGFKNEEKNSKIGYEDKERK